MDGAPTGRRGSFVVAMPRPPTQRVTVAGKTMPGHLSKLGICSDSGAKRALRSLGNAGQRERPAGGTVTLVHCWGHARPKLKEVFDRSGSVIAKAGLKRIARMYTIEKDLGGLPHEWR